jgi:hypothetical protein
VAAVALTHHQSVDYCQLWRWHPELVFQAIGAGSQSKRRRGWGGGGASANRQVVVQRDGEARRRSHGWVGPEGRSQRGSGRRRRMGVKALEAVWRRQWREEELVRGRDRVRF